MIISNSVLPDKTLMNKMEKIYKKVYPFISLGKSQTVYVNGDRSTTATLWVIQSDVKT